MEENQYLINRDNFSQYSHIESIPIYENLPPKNIRFTISIPTFQRVRTLRDALESAINQNFDDYHILVVDNNPERNDETESFMMTYKDNHRISYYKNTENIGLYGNWNRCVELAKGEWVTLLHDDDFYFPEYLSTYDKYLNKYPQIQCLNCNYLQWIEKERKDEISNIERDKLPDNFGVCKLWKLILFFSHVVGPVGVCYKRENVLELGGFNPDIYPSADYEFHIRYLMSYNIYKLNTCMVHYRIGLNVYGKPETQDNTIIQNFFISRSFAKELFNKKVLLIIKDYQLSENLKELKNKFSNYKTKSENIINNKNYNLFFHLCHAKYYWWVYRFRIRIISKLYK